MSSKRNTKFSDRTGIRPGFPEPTARFSGAVPGWLSLAALLLSACSSTPENEALEWNSVVPGRDTVAYAAGASSPASVLPTETDQAEPFGDNPKLIVAPVEALESAGAPMEPGDSRNVESPSPVASHNPEISSGEDSVEIPSAVSVGPRKADSPDFRIVDTPEEAAFEEVGRHSRVLPAEPVLAEETLDEQRLVPDPNRGDLLEVVGDPEPAPAAGSISAENRSVAADPSIAPEPVLTPLESSAPAVQTDTTWNDSVVARVNGAPILFSELKEFALDQQLPLSGLTVDGARGDAFRRAMTARVDQTLLVQAANLESLTADELQVARRVDAFIAQRIDEAGGRAEFLDQLRRAQLNLESFRDLLIKRETRKQLASGIVSQRVTISSSELEAFKKRLKENGEPAEEVQLAQILVSCPAGEQESELGHELFSRALDLAARAGRQPAAFSKILSEINNDPTGRAQGGLLGWIDPSTLQPAIARTVRELHPGEVSPPVTTDAGYHVLFVLDHRDARDKLFVEKFEEQRNRLITELRAKAQIEIYSIEGAG
jgi:parvulin-like peptidyl-prolyl isomerase